MLPPVPIDPDDQPHVAHVFGDCLTEAIMESDVPGAESLWGELDSTAVQDWQLLFARTYAGKAGAA